MLSRSAIGQAIAGSVPYSSLRIIALTYDGHLAASEEKKWCGEQLMKSTKREMTPQAIVMPSKDQHKMALSVLLWVKRRLTNRARDTFDNVCAKMKSTSAA